MNIYKALTRVSISFHEFLHELLEVRALAQPPAADHGEVVQPRVFVSLALEQQVRRALQVELMTSISCSTRLG